MKIKLNDVEIDPLEPFKNDALERKESADILTNILLSINEPFVIGLDSPWGTGKTTFIKMWRQHLENQGFPTINYNAWENDFSDDPFLSLMSEIDSGIDELKVKFSISGEAIQKLEQVKKISTRFVKSALPAILKMATYGIVDIKQVGEDSLANFVDEFAKEKIKQYDESKKSLAVFRKQLKEFVTDLMTTEKCKDKPLIIFIDELDRCRPTFAIEILEKVKHFFSINGIVFILSIDKIQIGNSISSIYGLNMEIPGYLKRFIDLEYNLPVPRKGLFTSFLLNQFDFSKFFDKRTQNELRNDWDHILFIFNEMSFTFNLSLREQLQLFTHLSLTIRMTPLDHYLFGIPLSFLIILKHINKGLYFSYVEHKISWRDIIKFVETQKSATKMFQHNYGQTLIAYLVWFELIGYDDRIDYKQFEEVVTNPDSTRDAVHKASRIVTELHSFSNKYNNYGNDVLISIVKKIELLDRFVSHE